MSSLTLAGGDPSLGDLRHIAAEERCAAVVRMLRDSAGDARQALLRVGAELVPESDLVTLLRNEGDDVARNAGLEMIKLRGRRALRSVLTLLADRDDDVVMQGVQLVDHIGDPRSWLDVRALLYHANPNVVQVVIAAAPRIGGSNAAIDILPFVSGDPWLQMSAIDALGRLRSRFAVPFLRKLLDDGMLSEFAAEALARIGGTVAARILANFFIGHESELDLERWLGLLACALADLEQPHANGDLRDVLRRYLETPHAHLAAACLLALGPGSDDAAALNALATRAAAAPLPLCLMHRDDLIPVLLCGGSPQTDWGLALARLAPNGVNEQLLERALLGQQPDDPAVLADLAPRIMNARALVALFTRASAESRAALHPALQKMAAQIPAIVASEEIDAADRLLLLDIAGSSPAELARQLVALDTDERITVLSELRNAAVAEQLPWQEWIDTDGCTYLPLFAEAVARCRSERLLSLFHALLSKETLPVLAKAAGAMSDLESVPLLIRAYDCCSPLSRAFILEALGEIGGLDARDFLRRVAFESPASENRLACRAFARCASATDLSYVEALASDDDWAVRLAAVDAFGRLGAFDHPSLKILVADPSALVAQKANALLDLVGRDE